MALPLQRLHECWRARVRSLHFVFCMDGLQSILVPVDGSPPSLAALDHAIVLAQRGDATITVLHVTVPDTLAAAGRDEVERSVTEAFQRAHDRLGDRVLRRTTSGDPLRTIVETARDGHYDLVVIGTHGRVGRLHAMLGSVAEGVVRNAPCPVLTVRDEGGGYQSFAERRHGRPSVAEAQRPSR
jgi:nucleotide-binding universal stress UspA family protein